jgi:putative hemolysin
MNRLEIIKVLAENPAVFQAREAVVPAANIPTFEIAEGHYRVRFARTPEEIDAALKLRSEVFNLELGEGRVYLAVPANPSWRNASTAIRASVP